LEARHEQQIARLRQTLERRLATLEASTTKVPSIVHTSLAVNP